MTSRNRASSARAGPLRSRSGWTPEKAIATGNVLVPPARGWTAGPLRGVGTVHARTRPADDGGRGARGVQPTGADTVALDSFTIRNLDRVFVPVSRLNQLRRDLIVALEEALTREHNERVAQIVEVNTPVANPTGSPGFRWSMKVDRVESLDALEKADVDEIDEIIVDIIRDHPALLMDRLKRWEDRVGRQHIRLALPAPTRFWEEKGLRHKIEKLRGDGWSKWEAANLSAWSFLDVENIDLATDWSVYVLNRLAADALASLAHRASRFRRRMGLPT